MSDYTETELATYFAERDRAEAEGLYDTIEDPSILPMTEEQEQTLHQACSWLSDLAKETNSSLSEILKRGGITAQGNDTKRKDNDGSIPPGMLPFLV